MKRQNLESREQMLFSNGGTFERPGAARHWQEQEVVRTVRKIRLFTAILSPWFGLSFASLYFILAQNYAVLYRFLAKP